MIFKTGNPNHR